MRVFSKSDGDKLANKLAAAAKQGKAKPVIVTAAAPADVKDEAKQSAISYWLMGWNWDEIETVLEDSEYPKGAISYAMKEAKEYAGEILNKGPFATMTSGQGVRLINGEVGTLEDRYADHIKVSILGHGPVYVKHNQLDVAATNKLAEAFGLRKQAAAMVEQLPDGKELAFVCTASGKEAPASNTLQNVNSIISQVAVLQEELTPLEDKSGIKLEASDGSYATAVVSQEAELAKEIKGVLGKLQAKLNDLYDFIASSDESTLEPLDEQFNKDVNDSLGSIDKHVAGLKHLSTAKPSEWDTSAWKGTNAFFDAWNKDMNSAIAHVMDYIDYYIGSSNDKTLAQKITCALRERV